MLTHALDVSPNSIAANLALGKILLTQQRYPEAMDRFETVLAMNSRDPQARGGELDAATSLALKARGAGKQDAALLCLQHTREFLPDDATLLTDLGIQAHSMHLLVAAAESLNAALALQPGNPTALYALARVEIDQEHFASAEQHLRGYLAAHPADASAYYGLGHLFYMQQRIPEAEAEFRRSIELQPVQTESYYQLGEIRLDAHHDAEARPLFEKTLARSATHGGALTGMGILAYRAKDYISAQHYLTHAAEVSPGYQPAHYYLGLALARLGDKSASDRELSLATTLAAAEQARPHSQREPAPPVLTAPE